MLQHKSRDVPFRFKLGYSISHFHGGKVGRVLITGASSGIGVALAEEFAGGGHELLLVARRRANLESVAQKIRDQHNVSVQIFVADLTQPEELTKLEDYLEGNPVDILINNAGMGQLGHFHKADWGQHQSMLRLNMEALTRLTYKVLSSMIQQKNGYILNVASVAAFQSVPYFSVYAASKSYVLSFSEGLREEVLEHGVQVAALCPGPTESEFFERAGGSGQDLLMMKNMASAKAVAKSAYHGLMKGQAIIVPGVFNQLSILSSRFFPRAWVRKISALMFKPRV